MADTFLKDFRLRLVSDAHFLFAIVEVSHNCCDETTEFVAESCVADGRNDERTLPFRGEKIV